MKGGASGKVSARILSPATAFLAVVGNIQAFRDGREVAAWMGLTPRQHSTGGKKRLLGISKRGNVALRWLFVVGAQSVIRQLANDFSKYPSLCQLNQTFMDTSGATC